VTWPNVRLSSIFEIARGGSPRPISEFITDDPDGLNWISIKDASNSAKYITKTKLKIRQEGLVKSRLVRPGDFLLTNSMSFGRPYIMKTTGCIHDGWLVLSGDKQKVNQDYFYYLLGSEVLHQKFSKLAAGAVVKNLNIDLVKGVEIPLPPLAEQKKIAAILDAADQLRQKDQQLIDHYTSLSQSLFLEMFGDPVSNPMGWDKVPLSDFGKINSGSTPSRKDDQNYNGEIPWVKTGEVVGEAISETAEHISKIALENSSCNLNPKGSLVIAMYGQGKTRGRVGRLGIEAATNQACAVLPPTEIIDFDYLFCLLKLLYEDLRQLGRGGNQPNLNCGLIKDYLVIFPPKAMQSEFAARLLKVETQRSIVHSNVEKSALLFNSLLQKAFKGELTSNKAA